MRNAFAWVVGLAVVAGAPGCGDKGDKAGEAGAGAAAAVTVDPTSAVGRWTADMTPIVAMMKPMLEMAVKMAESMPQVAGADAGDSKKKLDEAKRKFANLDKMKMDIDLAKDGSATMDVAMANDAPESAVGSWTQTGDQVTIAMKTSNGKALEGRKAEPKTLTLKDGSLIMSDGGMSLTFKRR